jgi:hypothetical protein
VEALAPDDLYQRLPSAVLSRWEKIKRLTLERREEEDLGSAL